jgi:hypothetical protein
MIHYQLHCAAAHDFDGWYKDSAAFDQLCASGLVECPHCGSPEVTRALMAPAIASRRRPPPAAIAHAGETMGSESKAVVPAAAAPAAAEAGMPETLPPEARLPDRMRAMLQRMRAVVEQNCDYVGPDFAAEARRIHDGEAEPRGIYGEATPEEAEALADDGIDVARIPWVPRAEG